MSTDKPNPTGKETSGASRALRGLLRGGKQAYISALGQDSYERLRASWRIRQVRRLDQPLLLVHTMGKVGSTSTTASLKELGYHRSMALYQPHFLSDEWLSYAEEMASGGSTGWKNLAHLCRTGFPYENNLDNELRRRRAEGKRVAVITLVRDPVAVNISGFFHNQQWWPAELRHPVDNEPTVAYLDALKQAFLDDYTHEVPGAWYDREFRPLYDIDVFASPFDISQGYAIYHSNVADALLLKLEQLDQSIARAFHEFMGIEHFHLVTSNLAESKEYATVYKAFRKRLVLPDDYLNQIYGSKLARHFYTPDEITAFRRKWRGR